MSESNEVNEVDGERPLERRGYTFELPVTKISYVGITAQDRFRIYVGCGQHGRHVDVFDPKLEEAGAGSVMSLVANIGWAAEDVSKKAYQSLLEAIGEK